MKLLMENWRKFLKEETAEERRKRQAEKKAARDEKNKRDREERAERMARRREESDQIASASDQRQRKRDEERAARDAEWDRYWRLRNGDWTKEDKEYVLLTYEDEIEDFEETYGRKPRKMEIVQYITKRVNYTRPTHGSLTPDPTNPLNKQIGSKPGTWGQEGVRLGDAYKNDIENSILPLPGKSGFDQWAERAESQSGGKPQDVAKAMIRWMRNGAVMSDHPNGIQAGLSDSQIGDIFRTTELTPDGVFQSMDILVKRGSSPEDAASIISGDIEPPTQLNPDFDPDQEESKDNPERIDFVVADPGTLMRIYKYYKAAGL